MRVLNAAMASLIFTIGGAAACAAADLPREDEFVDEQPARHLVDARVFCNEFGRCVRLGQSPAFYGQGGFEARPRFYGRPGFEDGPGYRHGPDYGARGAPPPDFDRPRPRPFRYGDGGREGPADGFDRDPGGERRPRTFGRNEERPDRDPRPEQGYDERY